MTPSRAICALTIAGSDCGGGAGVQADLKTFAAHGIHGLSALTALTAQNTRRVGAVHVPPPRFLRAQIDACFEDFQIGAVKIGMLGSARVIEVVADALEHWQPRFVVLDPVLRASSGEALLPPAAARTLRKRLLPLATLLTPNLPEASWLLGHPVTATAPSSDRALAELLQLGPAAILLKGGHGRAESVIDRFADGNQRTAFRHPRLKVQGHGTGCALSSAIAANVCLGMDLPTACEQAIEFVHGALLKAQALERGKVAILDHFWRDEK